MLALWDRSGDPANRFWKLRKQLLQATPCPSVQFVAPCPLPVMVFPLSQQIDVYSRFTVNDDLILPPGYTYDVIGAWGDLVGDSRFGYNNDYLSFVETAPNAGYLTINFEYISAATWMETYPAVIQKDLPLDAFKAAAEAAGDEGIAVATLADTDPLKVQTIALCKEALTDVGLGVISLRRNAEGAWERSYSQADRRISGISGLEDERYLTATGAAVAVFEKQAGQGYIDGLGSLIVGSFNNCAGGNDSLGHCHEC